MKRVLIVANMAATFGGNFIESMLIMQNRNSGGVEYLLPEEAKDRDWISRLSVVHYTDWTYGSLRKVWKKINAANNIDVVHFHFISGWNALHCRMAFRGSARLIWHLHMHIVPPSGKLAVLKKAFYHIVYSNSYKIGVSKSVADEIKIYSDSNICVIHNALDFKRLMQYEKENYIREKAAGKINCMVMGNHYERKGVDVAFLSVYNLWQQGYDIMLYIAMNDIFVPKAERFLKSLLLLNHVDITQFVKFIPARNDIATYYKKIDVFLSPSRSDTWTWAIDEAAYCGCMVIASNVPGQNENNVPGFEWIGNPNIEDVSKDMADKILFLHALS